jgi:hypothetical protein
MENIDRIQEILESDDFVFRECWHHWVNTNRYYDEKMPEDWREFCDKIPLILYVEKWELI